MSENIIDFTARLNKASQEQLNEDLPLITTLQKTMVANASNPVGGGGDLEAELITILSGYPVIEQTLYGFVKILLEDIIRESKMYWAGISMNVNIDRKDDAVRLYVSMGAVSFSFKVRSNVGQKEIAFANHPSAVTSGKIPRVVPRDPENPNKVTHVVTVNRAVEAFLAHAHSCCQCYVNYQNPELQSLGFMFHNEELGIDITSAMLLTTEDFRLF